MNCLMAAMVPVAAIAKANVPGSESPLSAAFWFIMSMALLAGFIAAYPMNWWLVSNHLKHGMMTVRPKKSNADQGKEDGGMKWIWVRVRPVTAVWLLARFLLLKYYK